MKANVEIIMAIHWARLECWAALGRLVDKFLEEENPNQGPEKVKQQQQHWSIGRGTGTFART